MQFGQKGERFKCDPPQGLLPFESPAEEVAAQQQEIKEQITYTRKKQSAHNGRSALPAHLPVEEIEIHPEGDLTDMICIGKEVTEELECELRASSFADTFGTNMPLKAAMVLSRKTFQSG